MAAHDVVLGPAVDGGYWLVGLRALHESIFRGIRWSTSSVLAETLAICQRNGLTVHRLRELHDVDTAEDWQHFLQARQNLA
jgi:glycosyltransferase A (GT-A) superfamily protein (DUF2064 family)